MDKLNCPHCGCEVLNDAQLAGQVVGCPNCGKPFRMPDAPRGNDHFAGPAPAPAAPPPQAPQAPQAPASSRRQQPASATGEPWCYGFLEKNTFIILCLGVVQAVLVLVLVIYWSIATLMHGNILLAFAILITGLLAVVLLLAAFVFAVALVRLAVDMGRNLRALQSKNAKER